MPARSRTSFQKRQKELLRAEKQRDKAARRQARKLAPKETGDPEAEPEAGLDIQNDQPENPQDSSAVPQ